MRLVYGSALALAIAIAASVPAVSGQGQGMGDADRAVANGGIFAPGWMGKIDLNAEKQGQSLNNARFAAPGSNFQVTTGRAVTYWNPKNVAAGNYTVKATFTEAKYMSLNNHPHPYGIVIAGNEMGTPNASFLYCATYGDGRFIVRGFGPAPFQMNAKGAQAPSINKAAGPGSSVTQEIALIVKGNAVECAVNGAVVGTYDKAALVAAGKLKSTDGVYGLRFAHNTEATVTGLTMTKN